MWGFIRASQNHVTCDVSWDAIYITTSRRCPKLQWNTCIGTQTMYSLLLTVALVFLTGQSQAGKILIYPYGHCLNSHLLNAETLTRILLGRGHSVSMLISEMYNDFDHHRYQPRPRHQNLTMLQFPAPSDYKPICEYDTVDFMMYSPLQERFDAFIETSVKYCDQLLSNKDFLQSIKEAKFDVFIMEALDPCSRILADYLRVPFIPLMTAGLGHWDGNPRLPSYLPAAIAPFTNKMTFTERMGNFLMKFLYENIPVIMGFDLHFQKLKEKYDMDMSLSLSTTFNRAAIKLINSDFSIEYPAPIEPDSILVGGFSLKEPKPLSEELEAFMQSAGEAGVIVMSTGTLVKNFDERWTRLFADAFSRLPQKVIWRYDGGAANNSLGDNVKLVKWLPQLDLLSHPQTRLFITHCGLNALFEAVFTATPVVAVPMSGDQMNNAAKLTSHAGMGVTVDMFSVTSDSLHAAIVEVLGEERYADNAREVSERFKDQPMKRDEKLNYWVDYVIRTKGANHLRSPASELSFVKYFCLDVLMAFCAIAVTVTLFVCVLLYYVVTGLKKRLFKKSKLE